MAEIGNALREPATPEITFYTDKYAITSGLILTINHGLADRPRQVWLRLKNVTAELGYAVGDEIELTASSAVSVASNKTQIKLVFATLPTVVNFSSNAVTAITAVNWNLLVKAQI